MTTSSTTQAHKPLAIGIAGLGTVGAGVIRLLRENAAMVTARCGRRVEVVAVSARDRHRDRGVDLSGITWFDRADDMASDPAVDIVVELIGGAEGMARTLVEKALDHKKSVVTANKALIALHGARLSKKVEQSGALLMFEAAVAGGVPVIKTVREGLASDRLTGVRAILNGTCNYILSTMESTGRDFSDVLAEAQALGYAEADPSTDVDGIDAAHKLTILAALAFGWVPDFAAVYREGIRHISREDMDFARELGYKIRLVGSARHSARGLELGVYPALVGPHSPLFSVDGVLNAVVVDGAFVGRVMLEGPGAGAGPTAMAVVTDIIDIARGSAVPLWGASCGGAPAPAPGLVPHGELTGEYYLRLGVRDRPGVVADITAVLRDHGVSLRSFLQHGRSADNTPARVPLVIVTHETQESAMRGALDKIRHLEAITEEPRMIRIVEN